MQFTTANSTLKIAKEDVFPNAEIRTKIIGFNKALSKKPRKNSIILGISLLCIVEVGYSPVFDLFPIQQAILLLIYLLFNDQAIKKE